jgi:hypothetical protein
VRAEREYRVTIDRIQRQREELIKTFTSELSPEAAIAYAEVGALEAERKVVELRRELALQEFDLGLRRDLIEYHRRRTGKS